MMTGPGGARATAPGRLMHHGAEQAPASECETRKPVAQLGFAKNLAANRWVDPCPLWVTGFETDDSTAIVHCFDQALELERNDDCAHLPPSTPILFVCVSAHAPGDHCVRERLIDAFRSLIRDSITEVNDGEHAPQSRMRPTAVLSSPLLLQGWVSRLDILQLLGHDQSAHSPVLPSGPDVPAREDSDPGQGQEQRVMSFDQDHFRRMILDVFRDDIMPVIQSELFAPIRAELRAQKETAKQDRDRLQVIRHTLEAVRDGLAASTSKRRPLVPAGLTAKQRAVFKKIEGLGPDAGSRFKAQELLNSLQKDTLTESFVRTLQGELKAHQWGIVCTCGAAAAPLWKPDSTCIANGRMQLSHVDQSGKSVVHGSYVMLSKVILSERPDRRRRKVRRSSSR